jgi:hypothetical protein
MGRIASNPFMTNKYVQVGRFSLLSTGALRQFEIIHLTEFKNQRLVYQTMFWEKLNKAALENGMDIEQLYTTLSNPSEDDKLKYASLLIELANYNREYENETTNYGRYLTAYLLSTRLNKKHKPLIIEAYEDDGITQLEEVEDYEALINLLGADEYIALVEFFVDEERKGEDAILARDSLKK